jgi:plastocyanin
VEVRRAALLSAYLACVKRKYVFAAASAAVVAFAIVCVPGIARTGSSSSAGSQDKRAWVRVMDNFFDPRSVDAPQGAKVTFVWRGSNRHNVRFTKVPKGASRKGSKTLRQGRWSRTLRQAGVYRYVCNIFSGMRGTITVKPPAPADSNP